MADNKSFIEQLKTNKGRKGMSEKTRRFLASLVNVFFLVTIIINIVLWIMDKEPLGQAWFGTEGFNGDSKLVRFVFGLLAMVMYGSMIGFIINIVLWWQDRESWPVTLTKIIFNK